MKSGELENQLKISELEINSVQMMGGFLFASDGSRKFNVNFEVNQETENSSAESNDIEEMTAVQNGKLFRLKSGDK